MYYGANHPRPAVRATVRARGADAANPLTSSSAGVIPATRRSFAIQRSHSITSGPLGGQTRLTSGRVPMTALPNSSPASRHPSSMTGIRAIAMSSEYSGPSPLVLTARADQGGALPSFGVPTIRATLAQPAQPGIGAVRQRVLNFARR